jgi:Cu(I)/Ag(I) efflux system membrane fusion protein
LIRGGAVDRVVVALGDGRFRAQPVDVGIESGDRVEIRSGIAEGESIVTSGQFLIDSESNIESALMRMDEDAAVELPNRVHIGAIVRETDLSSLKITLQHEPVPEWSWPAMTMSFDVADRAVIENLGEGQSVDVVVEKLADGRHRITEIIPNSTSPEPIDHSGHDMEEQEAEPVDHSAHDMGTN